MGSDFVARRLLHRVFGGWSAFSLSQEVSWSALCSLHLELIEDDGVSPLDLVLDRTNWKYGKTDINALVIGLVHGKVAVPVGCELLDKAGNSNSIERLDALDEVLKKIPATRIRALYGDREFIGEDWFLGLQARGVPYIMRVRENLIVTLGDGSTQLLSEKFAKLGKQNKSLIIENVILCGVRQNIQAMRLKTDELLIVAFHGITEKCPLAAYRKRWAIETLFSHMKTKGFDIEATHMRCMKKLKKLFAVVSIAVVWALKIGQKIEQIKPTKIKKHGYKAVSTFLRGKRAISRAAKKPQNKLKKLCAIFRKITKISEREK